MGNHAVGKAMGLSAEMALRDRKAGETAIAMLDRICEPYRGYDAEFEAEDPNDPGNVHPDIGDYTDPHPKAALGMLMVEAFAPNGLDDLPRYQAMLNGEGVAEVEACDAWFAEVERPFSARYKLC